MVDKNDSLYREVEEELRRERMARLWDKYGVYVVGLFAVAIAGIGGHQLWQGRQQTLAAEGGALYDSASRLAAEGKTDEALKAFATLEDGGHPGYVALAALQSAGADLKAGKPEDALAQYEKISKDSTSDPLLKSFATLQAASLRLGKADLPEMQNRLNALAADGNPWRFNAREMLGMAAYKAGDIVAATKEFDRILSDPLAPQGVAARVRVLMGTIMAQTLAKVPAAVTPPDGSATAAPAAEAKPAPEAKQPSGDKKEPAAVPSTK